MAYGMIDKALYWLGMTRRSSTVSKFLSTTSYATIVDAEYIERCGVITISIHFTVNSSLSVPVDGNCSDVHVATLKSKFRPSFTTAWMSRGGGYQIFGTIGSDGKITITGAGSHGSSFNIGTSANLYICTTYVISMGEEEEPS